MQHHIFKKLFGPEAKNYTKYRAPYPKELFDLLIRSLPKDSVRILDVGCGTGKSTEPLVATGLKVTGVDHDSQMIEEAKAQAQMKYLDIDYQVSDVVRLPFVDKYFDTITVGTAFHFFMNKNTMKEIMRVLKPGGLLFVYWTLTTKDIPEEDEIPADLYKKYHWIKIPSKLRDLENVSNFFISTGFQNVITERIPIVYQTTVKERVGLQMTSGFYETLIEQEKKNFLDDVKIVLTEKLGNRPYFTLEEEIQVCYGFKDK